MYYRQRANKRIECARCHQFVPLTKNGTFFKHYVPRNRMTEEEKQKHRYGNARCDGEPLGHNCPACDGTGRVPNAGEFAE